MKKLLALMLALLCACSARAVEVPQQEGIEDPVEAPVVEETGVEEIEQEEIPQEPVTEEEPCRLSAYLPLNAYSEDLLHSGLMEQLDSLTVNVGCYWRADGTLEIKDGLLSTLQAIETAHPDLQISCTINPKNGAAAAIDTAEERTVLVGNMLTFCEEQQLDGVDIDWEFPQDTQQWSDFSALIVELSEALSSEDRSLSLAFYPEDVNLSAEAIKAVHSVHIMAYDQFDEQGYHSTYEGAEEAITYFKSLGFAEEQLILGIPAYGRPLDGSAQWPLYCDHAAQLSDGTDLLGNNYFNSPQTAAKKAELACQQKLQGVFLYHLGCDSHDDSALTKALRDTLNSYK